MAKKPAKETSLPVVISLVFFVLTSIGLGVFVYVLFSDQEAKDAEVAKAKDEVKSARALAKEAELTARALRVLVGVPESDDLTILQQDVKEGDKTHQEIKKVADAVKKKAPEVTKAVADRFNAIVKAYADDPKNAPLDAAKVLPGDLDVWSGDIAGGQLKGPEPGKTAVEVTARAATQRELAYTQAATNHDKYALTLTQLAKASEDYKTAGKDFATKTDTLPAEFKAKMKAMEDLLTTKTNEYIADKAKDRVELDKLTTQIEELGNQKRRLKDDIARVTNERDTLIGKLKPPDPLQFDEAQAKVLRRLPNNVIEIDIGSRSLVKAGLTFNVRSADFPEKGPGSLKREVRKMDERGVMRTEVIDIEKATVEVIEVLGPDLSRARITGEYDTIRESVLPGDLLYNPLWRKGVGEHVALIGVFDINGDGTDDVESVTADLNKMGIIVDAVFDLRTQAWKGRLGERTRFLVEGYTIPVSANDPHQSAKASLISKMGAAREEARNRAIQVINFRDFFGRMGYRINPNVPEERIGQAVARYFAAVGSDPLPMTPKE